MSDSNPVTRTAYTCVLFDLDNTLVDTDPLIRVALSKCGCSNVEQLPDELLRETSPVHILQQHGCGQASDDYWPVYDALAADKAQLLDGETPNVLDSLSRRGVRLGIVTSCRKPTTEALLRACGILHFFSRAIVTYGTCRQHKPHPEPILRALVMLQHGPTRAIYIGDCEKDEKASHGAGVHFGLASWARLTEQQCGDMVADVTLNRIRDILDFT